MKKKQRIRMEFRFEVFKRDSHKCKFCDETVELDAHHIIDRSHLVNGGYIKENGITLCKAHHKDAERWHESDGEDYVEGMHPDDLFSMIGSSRDLVLKKDTLKN